MAKALIFSISLLFLNASCKTRSESSDTKADAQVIVTRTLVLEPGEVINFSRELRPLPRLGSDQNAAVTCNLVLTDEEIVRRNSREGSSVAFWVVANTRQRVRSISREMIGSANAYVQGGRIDTRVTFVRLNLDNLDNSAANFAIECRSERFHQENEIRQALVAVLERNGVVHVEE